jgi:hypothetical protein
MIKKKRKNVWRMIALTLMLCLVVTTMPAMAFASEQEETTGSETAAETVREREDLTMDNVIEDESSEYVTTFDLGEGQKAKVFSSYPVRYETEAGKYADVEPELVAVDEAKSTRLGTSLSDYAYENKAGASKQYLPKSMSESTPVIMENEEYSISMTPTGWLNGLLNKNKHVQKKKEDMINIAGETEEKEVTAIYESTAGEASLEYTSFADGLKESIVLNEAPKKNAFSYKLTLKGLTAKVNQTDAGITFYDAKTGRYRSVYGGTIYE